MIDEVTLGCTLRAVEAALQKVEQVQGLLATAEAQIRDPQPALMPLYPVYDAEVRLAQVHGSLAVVVGWLAEARKEDPK
jgi:hypothetical protein